MDFEFERDRHGNLRVVDFDSTRMPWPEDKRPARKVRRERQQKRSLKFFVPTLTGTPRT